MKHVMLGLIFMQLCFASIIAKDILVTLQNIQDIQTEQLKLFQDKTLNFKDVQLVNSNGTTNNLTDITCKIETILIKDRFITMTGGKLVK